MHPALDLPWQYENISKAIIDFRSILLRQQPGLLGTALCVLSSEAQH